MVKILANQEDNLVYLPYYHNQHLVSKTDLEFPVLIKITKISDQKELDFEKLNVRLHLAKIKHARYRHHEHCVYIDYSDFKTFTQYVADYTNGAFAVYCLVETN